MQLHLSMATGSSAKLIVRLTPVTLREKFGLQFVFLLRWESDQVFRCTKRFETE